MKKREFDNTLKALLKVPPPTKEKHNSTQELQIQNRKKIIEQVIIEADARLMDICKKYLQEGELPSQKLYSLQLSADTTQLALVTKEITPLKMQHKIREIVTQVLMESKLI